MEQGLRDFARRHQRIRDKHRKLSYGYYTHLNANGVIEHCPRREAKPSLVAPVAILVAAFFGFKILMLAHLGAAEYGRHLDVLAQGNTAERVGAVALAPDPVTRAIVGALQTGF